MKNELTKSVLFLIVLISFVYIVQAPPLFLVDSDNDGILDIEDNCVDTIEGAPVDPNGCSCNQKTCVDDGNPCTDLCGGSRATCNTPKPTGTSCGEFVECGADSCKGNFYYDYPESSQGECVSGVCEPNECEPDVTEREECIKGVEIKEEFKFRTAEWSSTNVLEGTLVELRIRCNICDGKSIVFSIFEDDRVGDDEQDYISIEEVVNGVATTTWESEWVSDLFTDPEYYFIATDLDTDRSIRSGLVSVNKIQEPETPEPPIDRPPVVEIIPNYTTNEIECYSNSDCGEPYYSAYFCGVNDDVYRTLNTPTCVNPGTINSACVGLTNLELVDNCIGREYCIGGYDHCFNVDDFPVILNPIGDKRVNENELLEFRISAISSEGDNLKITANLPEGATLREIALTDVLEEDIIRKVFKWKPTYDQAGNYEVTFHATDGITSVSETITIEVINVNRAPTAVISSPLENQNFTVDEMILFDGSDSYDPDGDDLDYIWDFGDIFFEFDSVTNHSYAEEGIYTATLIVNDGDLTAQESVVVSVIELIPEAELTVATLKDEYETGEQINLTDPPAEADGVVNLITGNAVNVGEESIIGNLITGNSVNTGEEKIISDNDIQNPVEEDTVNYVTNEEGLIIPNESYEKFVPREVIIKFTKESNVDSKSGALSKLQNFKNQDSSLSSAVDIKKIVEVESNSRNYNKKVEYGFDRLFNIKIDSDDVLAEVEKLKNFEEVEFAEPNYIAYVDIMPDDYYFQYSASRRWHLNNILGFSGYPNPVSDIDVDGPEAWDIEIGDENITIAIIDTGIDYDHEDLNRSVWINSAEDLNNNGIMDDSDLNGVDDDGNGFIDDVVGWDFVDTSSFSCHGNEDCSERDNDPNDIQSHGTHCAGIVSANTNNSIGIAGTCWNCKIMAVRAGWKTTNGHGSLEYSDIIAGINYAVDNSARIISMSFGSTYPSNSLKNALDYAFDNDVVLVAGAGNNNNKQKFYPAAFGNVIGVAAIDWSNNKASFSNYGSYVDIAAPGYYVFSTTPNQTYARKSGTSMAGPVAAGVAGLILSKNSDFSNEDVRQILRSSTEPVGSNKYIGLGRVNAYNALQFDSAPVANIDLDNALGDFNVDRIIDIIGSAAGDGFSNYSVYIGTGAYPDNWTLVYLSNSEVISDTLTTIDTSLYPEGLTTVKLIVSDNNGTKVEDRVLFTIDNIKIDFQNNNEKIHISQNENIIISGKAQGTGFISYSLSYKEHEDEDWIQIHTSESEIISGPLFVWDPDFLDCFNNFFDLKLEVISSGGIVKEEIVNNVYIDNCMLEGFPASITPNRRFTSPSVGVGDLDGDGYSEIVTTEARSSTSGSRGIYIFNHLGDILPGWPKQSGSNTLSSPILGNLDNDGDLEIVAGIGNNNLYVWNHDGTVVDGWPVGDTSSFITPTLVDLDNDGFLDIITGRDRKIKVFHRNGTMMEGWPVLVSGDPRGSAAIGDLDGDGDLEFVIGSLYPHNTYVFHHNGTMMEGWPKTTSYQIWSSPALADIDHDGDLEIFIGGNKKLLGYHHNGTVIDGWPNNINNNCGGYCIVYNSPVIGDIDNDEDLEIAISNQKKVYVFNADGTNLPGWPIDLQQNGYVAGTILGDIDGDYQQEILVVDTEANGILYAFNSDGTAVPGWPKRFPKYSSGGRRYISIKTPVITDIDSDGDVDVVLGAEDMVYVWDLPYAYTPTINEWPMFQQGNNYGGLHITLPPKSQILNTGTTDIMGNLFMEVQRLNNNSWETYEVVIDETIPRVVLAGEYLALDVIWNAENVIVNEPGTYRVYSEFRDDEGPIQTTTGYLQNSWNFSVAENNPPVAVISSPNEYQTFGVGEVITFDGSLSYDPEGDDLNYLWDLDDLSFRFDPVFNYSYAEPGEYNITFVVTDGEYDDSANVMINILAPYCVDSDGGRNYFEKGTTQTNNNQATDACLTDATTGDELVREYYCDGLNISYVDYTCADSCFDGACVSLYQIKTQYNMLEINESLNTVMSVISSTHLEILEDGQISNEHGDHTYVQLIELPESASVRFGFDPDDDLEIPQDYLKFDQSNMVYKYRVMFAPALKSDHNTNGGYLDDIEGKRLTLLGEQYIITRASHPSLYDISLTLMKNAINDILAEGATNTYTVVGTDYEVTASYISNTSVVFTVNGEVTDQLEKRDSYRLVDGAEISVRWIGQIQGTGVDAVEFYLGKEKIRISDTNTSPMNNLGCTATINNDISSNVKCKIATSADLGTNDEPGPEVYIASFDVYYENTDELHVPAGGRTSEVAENEEDEQNIFLFDSFDFAYDGLNITNAEEIKFTQAGPYHYKIRFTNKAGVVYDEYMFACSDLNCSEIKLGKLLGDGQTFRDLVVYEGDWISDEEYFVVSANEYSRILQFKDINTNDDILLIRDHGHGASFDHEVSYSNLTGNLILDGNTYQISLSADASGADIKVDLNADGYMENSNMSIYTDHGAEIFLNYEDSFVFISEPKEKDGMPDVIEAGFGFDGVSINIINVSGVELFEYGSVRLPYLYNGITDYGIVVHENRYTNYKNLKFIYPENQAEALVYVLTKGEPGEPEPESDQWVPEWCGSDSNGGGSGGGGPGGSSLPVNKLELLKQLGVIHVGDMDLSAFSFDIMDNEYLVKAENYENHIQRTDELSPYINMLDKDGGSVSLDLTSLIAENKENSRGYIVEFDEKPVLEYKKELREEIEELERSKSKITGSAVAEIESLKAEIPSKLAEHEINIELQHIRMEKEFEEKIENLEQRKRAEYKKVFNGVSLDISKQEAEELEKIEGVKKIHQNKEVRINLHESIRVINADDVWRLDDNISGNNITGQGVTIAIIDTGVDYTHPDLGGCFGVGCKVIGGYDIINDDYDPKDDHGHGTHVAATAAGNGVLKGVAPDAKIYSYKVLGSGGSGSMEGVIVGIERAVDPNQDGNFSDHVDIISMSLGHSGGYGDTDPSAIAVDNAVEAGVVSVIAAGNSGPGSETIGCPACARKAITVAASDKCNEIASFSSRGPERLSDGTLIVKPDISAPGVNICAAQWGDAWANNECLDSEHTSISGTSMATPHVAGTVALIKQANPQLTPEEIKSVMILTSYDIGYDVFEQGAGRVDVKKAVDAELIITPLTIQIDSVTETHFERDIILRNIQDSDINLSLEAGVIRDEEGNQYDSAYLNTTNILLPAGSSVSVKLIINIPQGLEGNLIGSVYINSPDNEYSVRYQITKFSRLAVNLNADERRLRATIYLHDQNEISSEKPLLSIRNVDSGVFSLPAGNYTVIASGDTLNWSFEYFIMENVEVPFESNVERNLNILEKRPFRVVAKSFDGKDLKLYEWQKKFVVYNEDYRFSVVYSDPTYGDRIVYLTNKPENNFDTDIILWYTGVPINENIQ
ncbi:S8 family serine peptidase [Candidatus Woesearchaeota archaeon]|nr:S8 family serine peptidase [Candidatus Woesearchaeota archaeon]